MFTCKQVSQALHKEDYRNIPPVRRFFLKLHVKLCVFCGRFNKQVMESQDMCRCYKENEKRLESTRPKLESDDKEALKKLLAKHGR